MSISETFTAESIGDTKNIAKRIAQAMKPGDVICLYGDLGSGKTYLTKFICEALGVMLKDVISPTFVYWREYHVKNLNINHFDFYRIDDISEAESTGFEEALLDSKAITIIEWAEKVKALLPSKRIDIKIKVLRDEERIFDVIDRRN